MLVFHFEPVTRLGIVYCTRKICILQARHLSKREVIICCVYMHCNRATSCL